MEISVERGIVAPRRVAIFATTWRKPETPMFQGLSSMQSAIENSDKYYWHQYIDTYEGAFEKIVSPANAVEFGVFKGASVAWLNERFPAAHVTAFDILPIQPEWPTGPHITYGRLDQADRPAIRSALHAIDGEISLMIEDGSHVPQHQASCLAEGFERLAPGGLYILEDIHTSHPLQEAFAHFSMDGTRRLPNALNVLLAFHHWQTTGIEATRERRASISHDDFFTRRDIDYLLAHIDRIEMYKRTVLPLSCYACRGNDFDYVNMTCSCGADLYYAADSMTTLIWKKPNGG